MSEFSNSANKTLLANNVRTDPPPQFGRLSLGKGDDKASPIADQGSFCATDALDAMLTPGQR